VAAPRDADQRAAAQVGRAYERKVVLSPGASPIAIEQYRRLAGTLHSLQMERGLKTLLVTSAVPGEGKTLTISNLALTLSESCRRRVLLIDADLRRPAVHTVFGLPNTEGLGEVLRSERLVLPLLRVSDSLSVLTAGQLGEPMSLMPERVRALLQQCAATFDWVLVDAAPVGFMPDAEMLARAIGAVLFVIAARSTQYQLVRRAIAALDPQWIVGTVLNQVEPAQIPAASYYEQYYWPKRSGK
jgi:capsular exopolysaccharide synthesis family protein